jgi:hypothetical protein
MRKRMGALSVAVAACLATLTAGTAEATTAAPAVDHEIRVVNRHATTVRVYVQDANGGLHMLGRVAASDFKVMKVPAKIAGMGKVQIKVFPAAPFEALTMGADGVQSRGFALDGRDAVNLYVECDLQRSTLEIANG